jgi:hypothetical protein
LGRVRAARIAAARAGLLAVQGQQDERVTRLAIRAEAEEGWNEIWREWADNYPA